MDLDKRKVILIMMRSTVNVMMGVILALATMKTRMMVLLMVMAMTRKSGQVLINHPPLWTALVGRTIKRTTAELRSRCHLPFVFVVPDLESTLLRA